MKAMTFAAVACASIATHALSAEWPQDEVEKAIRVVAALEKDYLQACVASSGTKIAYDVQQKDLDGNGSHELIVSSAPAELGSGVTACYGRVGSNMYVLANENGAWRNLTGSLGDDASFEYHVNAPGEMPDIEATGPGFCFPVHRFYNGEYRHWKVCDGNGALIFADAASWIEDKSTVAPSGSGEAVSTALAGTDISDEDARAMVENRSVFDHNGSAMIVDPATGTIVYRDPKKSIAGTVKPGALLFKSDAPWDPYDDGQVVRGTAYVFKKGCDPAPYEVSGKQQGWHTLVLKGPAPVRAKNGCKVIGYRTTGNSQLTFVSWGD